jgi:hypothetical protein
MPGVPESVEGVALCLLKIIVRAEGFPVEQLSETNKPERAGNREVRAYVLDSFVECLNAAKGSRSVPNGDSGRN